MNKRVDRPKHKLPLTMDGDVTDADMERYIRDNRAEINILLKEAQDDIANGRVAELEPLPEFLRKVRKAYRARRQKQPT